MLFINNIAISDSDKELVDFMPTSKYGVMLDTGGGLHGLLEKNGGNNFIFLDKTAHSNAAFNKNRYSYYSIVNDGGWMHFINGSNWANLESEDDRIDSLFCILENRLLYFSPARAKSEDIKGREWSFYIFNKKISIKISNK